MQLFSFIVILESSSNQTCPGDTVTYTCVTDTGHLVWRENNKRQVPFSKNHHPFQELDIFTVNLTNISGTVIVSTATINNALLRHNGTVLSCSDNSVPQTANKTIVTLVLSGNLLTYPREQISQQALYRSTISTPQPDIHLLPHPLLCHHQLGSSIGHTPLCTQLHCHC